MADSADNGLLKTKLYLMEAPLPLSHYFATIIRLTFSHSLIAWNYLGLQTLKNIYPIQHSNIYDNASIICVKSKLILASYTSKQFS